MSEGTEEDEYLRAQNRARARRLVALALFIAAAAVAAVLLLVKGGRRGGPDPARLEKVRAAMAGIPGDLRAGFAAAALVELEAGRLPAPLLQALDKMQGAPVEMSDLLAARALPEGVTMQALRRACPVAPRAIADAVALAPAAQKAAFCAPCADLCARLPSAPEGSRVGLLAFALVIADLLARDGGLDPTEETLLVWLLGG